MMPHRNSIMVPGVVRSIDESHAYLEFSRKLGCDNCRAKQGCGNGLLHDAVGAANRVRAPARFATAWVDGERINAEISGRGLLVLTVVAYLIPAASMLLGGWLGLRYLPLGGDAGTTIGAAAGLLFGLAGLMLGERRNRLAAYAGFGIQRVRAARG